MASLDGAEHLIPITLDGRTVGVQVRFQSARLDLSLAHGDVPRNRQSDPHGNDTKIQNDLHDDYLLAGPGIVASPRCRRQRVLGLDRKGRYDHPQIPAEFFTAGLMALREIIELSRCELNLGTFVEVGGLELAVFRFDEPPRAVVIDNACPHASGNLSGGLVEDGIVTCPWHDWQFRLETGVCVHSDKARVRRYAAEIRDGFVWADLSQET